MPLAGGKKIADPTMGTIYLGLFTMIFCLWPCGLIAVILGLQVIQIVNNNSRKYKYSSR